MKMIKIEDVHCGVYYVNPNRIVCFYPTTYEKYYKGRDECIVIELTNGRKIHSYMTCETLNMKI